MEGLDKTYDSLLLKINGLQTDNAQNLADIRQDLDNKFAENDKNWQVEHDSIRSETNILNQHLEEVRSLHLATDKRIVEMDAGNQQLLEKLLGVEKNLDEKLQGVNENANSLVTKVNSLDNETKNSPQTMVNLQKSIYSQTETVKKVDAERQQAEATANENMEATVSTNAKAIANLKAEVEDAITKIVNLQKSIYIQTETVKKVDAERQRAEDKAKEDMEATMSTNAKAIAIADLKAEMEDGITKIEITLKQEQTKDNSALLDRLNIVQDETVSNEGRIESLEKAGPEAEVKDAITKMEITLKQEQTKDNSALLDRLNIVQDATVSNEGRIESLEKAGPEATKNLILEINAKLKGYNESASQKLNGEEDNIKHCNIVKFGCTCLCKFVLCSITSSATILITYINFFYAGLQVSDRAESW